MHLSKYFLAFIFFVIFVNNFYAQTYYIDYELGNDTNSGLSKVGAWKHCPGMPEWAGLYKHEAGNTFIFKGGVVWHFTSTGLIVGGGSAGFNTVYTSDTEWFAGERWSQPIFDGGGSFGDGLTRAVIDVSGKSYVKIDNIKIQNIGMLYGNSRAILLNYAHDVEISSLTIDADSRHIISGGITVTPCNIKIHHNKISHGSNLIELAASSELMISGLEIYNNEFFDNGPNHAADDHGDGIHLFKVGASKFYQSKIYNNYFYGDQISGYGSTAMLYLEGSCSECRIYNNVFAINNTSQPNVLGWYFSPGVIVAPSCDGCEFVGNTIDCTSFAPVGVEAACKAGIVTNTSGAMSIKNNIFAGVKFGIFELSSAVDSTVFNNDSNLFYVRPDGYVGAKYTTYYNLEGWKNFLGGCPNQGNECASLNGNPLFMSAVDRQLQLNSPAKDSGLAVGSPYNTDIKGTPRPQGSAWDIGAYEYVESGGINAPGAPSGLRVR